MKPFSCMNCTPHPLRTKLYDELHIRPFPKVTAPQQISHLAFRAQKQDHQKAFELLADLCREQSIMPPNMKESSALDFGSFRLQWESHVEFYSLTIMRTAEPDEDTPDQRA